VSRPTLKQRLRMVNPQPERPRVLVNERESCSVVGSDNHAISCAMSLLIGVLGEHPGRLTPDQARDVIAWANR
jgi:hypothetical protein